MDTKDATQRFYDLVWPQLPALLRIARILTGNASDADDLAQETMLKAFRAIGKFKDGTNVKAWLTAILRNTRIDQVRAAAGAAATVSLEKFPQDLAAAPVNDEPQESWQSAEQALENFSDAQIIEALNRLPLEIRWTLLLVDVEGFGQDEAAKILEVPVGTVKSRAHRGRAMLRQSLLPVARDQRIVRE